MNKNTILTLGAVILGLALLVVFAISVNPLSKVTREPGSNVPVTPEQVLKSDHKNISYVINGKQVSLVNGKSEIEIAPGSATKLVTKYFGNEVLHDFDGDGRADVVFILTQNSGGSGVFYYVALALNTVNGYVGSDAVLLGDRIAPQTIGMSQNPSTPHVIVVNFAERKPGEAFTVQPSVGKSVWLKLDTKTMQLGEVVQNFEGEASPSVMKLDMKKWNWVSVTAKGGVITKPKTANKFTLTFTSGNSFSASTDCNGIGGEYAVQGGSITFNRMMSTLMYCENSQEGEFSQALSEVVKYRFTSKGELVFDLSSGGEMVFR